MIDFCNQLRWELYRMFARRRTYIGFGVFLGLEGLVLFLMTREGPQKWLGRFMERLAGGGGDEFMSALTISLIVVLWA